MKKYLLILLLLSLSCKEEVKTTDSSSSRLEKNEENPSNTEQLKEVIGDFNKVLDKSDKNTKDGETAVDKAEIERLFQLSHIPKEEYQEKINNPDTLKQLIKFVEKNRKDAKPRKGLQLKDEISEDELSSKDTPTGISIEEAILILEKELKGKVTPEKLKKIDSLSGTRTMSNLPEKDARKILRYVKLKEGKKLRPIGIKAGYMHDAKEAVAYLKELETMLQDYNDGTVKASASYKSRIESAIRTVKSAQKKIDKKSKIAKKEFKELNPDLYFGDDVGETFFGGKLQTAVYLPLGRLSFADKVVKSYHPQLKVLDLDNVLETPDFIQDNGAQTVTGIYSLGLAGSLTVQFVDNALTDVNGPDLYIFEIGKIEPTSLEISKDGIDWVKVGKIDGGVSEVDIAEFVKPGDLFYYVRLTDLKKYSALPGADVDAIAAIGAAMRLKLDSKVLFETGKSELKPEGLEALKELAESIVVLKKGNVIVEGHTDDVGDANFNKKLSLARSKSVVAELQKLIPSNQFKWKEKGLGESKPIVKNDSDENRAKNRRVEVLVVPN